MSHKDQKPERKTRKSYTISRNCLILILTPQPCKQWESDTDGAIRSPLMKTGRELFKDFQRENKHSFWNKPLANSMKDINFLGFFDPYTLWIKGSDSTLEVLREAYARRVLKPPRNFSIVQLGSSVIDPGEAYEEDANDDLLEADDDDQDVERNVDLMQGGEGDVNGIEIAPVQQAQFIPLTEVLCLIISEMNKRKLTATQDTIRAKLGECYNKMPIPSPEIIHKSLTHLLCEKKIEHSGQGYFIIGLEQQMSSSNSEDDDSGTEYSYRLKKPPSERAYLMYSDGQITKHTLPTFMIDIGTQTPQTRNEMHNLQMTARPVNFPVNPNTNRNGMQTIYEREPTSVGQSPQGTPEHGAAAAAAPPPASVASNNFQRNMFSQSMREKRSSPAKKNVFDRTSSMRVKMDIETGYLTSDSEAKPSCFGKLLGKSAKKAAFLKANNNSNKQNNLQTFAAQFPPSDVHDPFFNITHWQEKSPHRVAPNGNGSGNGNSKERIIEGAGNTAIVKEKKKKDGPLPKDSKSKSTQQYKVDHGKLTQTAQSLQQKYKAQADESMPESEAEFVRPTNMIEGKFRTKAMADQYKPQKKKVLSMHSDKIKHYFSTLRDTRPQHVKPFQGIGITSDSEMEEQLNNLPPGVDLSHLHSNSTIAVGGNNATSPTLPGQYCALPSESETESISAPSIVRQFVATSRAINETFSARKHGSPGGRQVANSNNGAPVRERPQGLSPNQPHPEHNGFNGALHNGATTNKQNGQKRAPLAGDDGDEFYDEDEIDDLMRHEVNHNASPSGSLNSPSQAQAQRVFSAYPEFQNQVHHSDGRLTHSNQNIHCAHKNEPLSVYNPQKAGYNGGSGSDHGSRSLPTTPSHENIPVARVVVHQRLESLCSSAGDSGFNSPRSSVSQGHNNNYDSPNGQHNGVSDQSLIKRHSLGSVLDNTNANQLKMTKSPSSTSTRSTGSENTVKSQVEKRKHRNGDYPSSPGSRSGSRGNLNRPTSFDVIGTL